MNISKTQLRAAARNGILSAEQADARHLFLQRQPGTGPAFNLTNVLYHPGCQLATGAMTLFMKIDHPGDAPHLAGSGQELLAARTARQ